MGQQKARYAVRLSDVLSFPQFVAHCLFAEFITSTSERIPLKEDFDMLVVLDGPASEDRERLSAFVSLLQSKTITQKLGRPFRIYQQGPRGGWRKLKPPVSVRQAVSQEGGEEGDECREEGCPS